MPTYRNVLTKIEMVLTGDPTLPLAPEPPAAAAAATPGLGLAPPRPLTPEEQELLDERTAALAALQAELGDCRRCKLGAGRNQIVFGTGSPLARVVFVGEAPGAEEDKQGIPFVGRAGQKLTQLIMAIGLSREEVYIANIGKCRPPENRRPEPDEIAACEPYLKRQLAIIKPKVICAMGNTAIQSLLKVKEGISKLRGQLFRYENIPVLVTFHPSFLIRPGGQAHEGKVLRDFQNLKALIDAPDGDD